MAKCREQQDNTSKKRTITTLVSSKQVDWDEIKRKSYQKYLYQPEKDWYKGLNLKHSVCVNLDVGKNPAFQLALQNSGPYVIML